MREQHGGAIRSGGAAIVAVAALLAVSVAGLTLASQARAVPGGPISGEPRVGETLTASPAHVYHWQRCDPAADPCTSSANLWFLDAGWSNIPGAQGHNDSSYLLTDADLGTMIRVLGNDVYLTDFVASPAVGPVCKHTPVNVSPPSISGSAIEGTTLVADDGTWQGENLSFTRQWQRSNLGGGWDNISGATRTTYKLTTADVNRQVRLRVIARNAAGESEPAFSEPTDVVVDPPEFDSTANLDPIEGTVLAQLPGSSQIREITELTQVPVGTSVDVTNGFVDMTTQKGPNQGLQTITLWQGTYVFGQRPKNRITVMRLTDALGGANRRGRAQTAAKAGKRRLWGRGRCRCRTRGRNSSGTARGTYWLTAERKAGTYTKVKEGKVRVRDFTRNRRVLVKAGDSYLAPNP
jgi:hypothetical protein